MRVDEGIGEGLTDPVQKKNFNKLSRNNRLKIQQLNMTVQDKRSKIVSSKKHSGTFLQKVHFWIFIIGIYSGLFVSFFLARCQCLMV